ncbi:transposase [Dyella sp. KRB-257]|uniref:transposase n=1 Tax=Dyella sp. KRB-257 TaxID=3400915 RepID=UPI003BFEFBB3
MDARRLLFATQGKDAATFEAFAEDLAAHGGDAAAITDVSLDLGAAYQAGTRKHCPNAKVSFDPFHVVALANTALDQVRRAEVKHEADLKGIRWGTLKDATTWTRKQVEQMHWLQRSNLQTARAWRLKQALREVFSRSADATQAKALLDAWIRWARRCRLAPFKRLAATMKKHRDGIRVDRGQAVGDLPTALRMGSEMKRTERYPIAFRSLRERWRDGDRGLSAGTWMLLIFVALLVERYELI